MKFILLTLTLGVALILGPIAHHAYYVSAFPRLLPAILNSSATFFELPATCYAISDGMGLLLTLTALFLGSKKVLAEQRAKQVKKPD